MTPTSIPVAAGLPVNGMIGVTDASHYSYLISFDVMVDSVAGTTKDTVNAKPGEAMVTWAPTITGPAVIANGTTGHTLPVEQWVNCGHSETGCMGLHGFWPIDSPVCTTKIAGRMRVDEVVPFAHDYSHEYSQHVQPADGGEYCELQIGWTVVIATRDPIPVGGSRVFPWVVEEKQMTLKDETQYQPLVDSLRAGPAVWAVILGNANGEVTNYAYNVDSCANAPSIVWSSKPLDCVSD
jgi:hypothetical protein